MTHENDIEDLDLEAFMDGEVSPDQAEIIEDAMRQNPALRERVKNLRSQKECLKRWWRQFHKEH